MTKKFNMYEKEQRYFAYNEYAMGLGKKYILNQAITSEEKMRGIYLYNEYLDSEYDTTNRTPCTATVDSGIIQVVDIPKNKDFKFIRADDINLKNPDNLSIAVIGTGLLFTESLTPWDQLDSLQGDAIFGFGVKNPIIYMRKNTKLDIKIIFCGNKKMEGKEIQITFDAT